MKTYDRLATGERIRKQRLLLGFTQDELAEKIERAAKYCADIERGSCGMSIETMLALSKHLGMSLDYMLLGNTKEDEHFNYHSEVSAILNLLNQAPESKRKYALELLKLFLTACEC